jgi:hypothetical protein
MRPTMRFRTRCTNPSAELLDERMSTRRAFTSPRISNAAQTIAERIPDKVDQYS